MLFARGHLNLYLSPSHAAAAAVARSSIVHFFFFASPAPRGRRSGYSPCSRKNETQRDTKEVLHGEIEDRFPARVRLCLLSILLIQSWAEPPVARTHTYGIFEVSVNIGAYGGKSKRILKRCRSPLLFLRLSFLSLDESPLTLCSCVLSRLAAAAGCRR